MNIKSDDTVLVITGKDKGKRGKVREVRPAIGKIIIEGINIVKKHTRGTQGARQAGIIEREAPLSASKVMVAAGVVLRRSMIKRSQTLCRLLPVPL